MPLTVLVKTLAFKGSSLAGAGELAHRVLVVVEDDDVHEGETLRGPGEPKARAILHRVTMRSRAGLPRHRITLWRHRYAHDLHAHSAPSSTAFHRHAELVRPMPKPTRCIASSTRRFLALKLAPDMLPFSSRSRSRPTSRRMHGQAWPARRCPVGPTIRASTICDARVRRAMDFDYGRS